MGHNDRIKKLWMNVTKSGSVIIYKRDGRRIAAKSKKARRNHFNLVFQSRKSVGRDRVLPCLPTGDDDRSMNRYVDDWYVHTGTTLSQPRASLISDPKHSRERHRVDNVRIIVNARLHSLLASIMSGSL
jgi:hypothetical protein